MVPTNLDLDWSFRPLSTWFRLTTGINLMEQNEVNKRTRVYQLLCLFINILSQIWVIYQVMNGLPLVTFTTPGPSTLTKMWNAWIDYLNWAIAAICEFIKANPK